MRIYWIFLIIPIETDESKHTNFHKNVEIPQKHAAEQTKNCTNIAVYPLSRLEHKIFNELTKLF